MSTEEESDELGSELITTNRKLADYFRRITFRMVGLIHRRLPLSTLAIPPTDEETARLHNDALDEQEIVDGPHLATSSETDTRTGSEIPWTLSSLAAAAILCLGTSFSTLFFQRLSNAVPQYFYAVAIVSPLLGFLCYSFLLLVTRNTAGGTIPILQVAPYACSIGMCFALHNILVDYGRSGKSSGQPDVPTVLSLILLKLVVPVSLFLESLLERRRPTLDQIAGVAVFLVGIGVATSRTTSNASSIGNGGKVLALVISSVPLALGFYIVKVARERLPQLSGTRLWQVLCLPEIAFSTVLAYASQHNITTFADKTRNIYEGVLCVLLAHEGPAASIRPCRTAATFLWSGLPFGLALNLSIPMLIQLKGSATSVPLFRAMALPIASLLAMCGLVVDTATPFSTDTVAGVLLCSLGLLVFYRREAFDRDHR